MYHDGIRINNEEIDRILTCFSYDEFKREIWEYGSGSMIFSQWNNVELNLFTGWMMIEKLGSDFKLWLSN